MCGDLNTIDELAAPQGDEQVLVQPDGRSLVDRARANRRWRQTCRQLPGFNPSFPSDDDRPLVFMAGHQPEFFHPGVWAKSAAAFLLAQAAGGQAGFLVVDSDRPVQVGLNWPDDSDSYCRVGAASVRMANDRRSYEHIPGEVVDRLSLALKAVPDQIHPGSENLMTPFRSAFDAATGPSESLHPDYVARWISAVRAVEATVGVRDIQYVRIRDWFAAPASGISRDPVGRAAVEFMRHLILNARSFATCYNTALARYRRRRGIRGNQHPIPDLALETDRVELPFWHIDPAAPRCRVFVTDVEPDFVRIEADGITLDEFTRSLLQRSPDEAAATRIVAMGLRPRALPQTLFARLHACDLFIHGIGGAKYDTITDDIIRAFFKIEPPAYACVTATWRLPVRRFDVSEDQLAGATFAARDLRYNLLRYANPGEFAPALSREIDARARAIRESDRLHRERSRDHARRRTACRAIRRANAALLQGAPGIARRLTEELTKIRLQLASNRIAKSREWFFALHTRESLATLFDQLKRELSPDRRA